jgi:hypothetical protein
MRYGANRPGAVFIWPQPSHWEYLWLVMSYYI